MGTTLKGVRLPIRIRFVGGCWHNCLLTLNTLASTVASADGVHTYHLAEFYTKRRTAYYQYIHESMIWEDTVNPDAFVERFPYWDLDPKAVESKGRLRRPRQAYRQN